MKIQTKAGISEDLPLSDIQENNRWLKVLAISFSILVVFIILTTIFAFWYANKYHVVAYLAGAGL